MKPRTITQQAFRAARRYLAEEPGFCNLNGYCLEASVLMHKYLTKRGVEAKLVRYEDPAIGGHFTVRVPEGEFDPTIGCWPDAPKTAKCDALYPVTAHSPHRRRWRRTPVNTKVAYESVWIKGFDGVRLRRRKQP